ncbi:hypothetical protein MMC20_006526 [Loxospora ochrophaea]|nr:hypothetical protein [Loxospora ochrophaea]
MATVEPRTKDVGATEVDPTTSSDPVAASEDPFANQRSPDDDPFANQRVGDSLPDLAASPPSSPEMPRDRRMSKEWDASKVPPSRFQKREGSIFSTPGSRDGHVEKGRDRDQEYHEKLKEKKKAGHDRIDISKSQQANIICYRAGSSSEFLRVLLVGSGNCGIPQCRFRWTSG